MNRHFKYLRYYANILRMRMSDKLFTRYQKNNYSPYFNKRRRYAGTIVHTSQESQDHIAQQILSKKPFMAARFGSTELYTLEVYDWKIESKYTQAIEQFSRWSGFFPCEKSLMQQFVQLMKDTCNQVDTLAIWNMFMEAYYIKHQMKKEVYLTQLRFLEPWYAENPWTRALKGKKVLVIHPFTESIQKQYEKREHLFPNKDILPEFTLLTLKAVQTVAGEKDSRFETWFDALDWMYREAMKIDFDIALIGCGAYGMPLAAKIKQSGKQAIHMAGVLQILFGIKGARWDDDPVVSKLYNEYWVRPSENEKPKQAKVVEGGCYW